MSNNEHVNELWSSGAPDRVEAIDWLQGQAERLRLGDPDANLLCCCASANC